MLPWHIWRLNGKASTAQVAAVKATSTTAQVIYFRFNLMDHLFLPLQSILSLSSLVKLPAVSCLQ